MEQRKIKINLDTTDKVRRFIKVARSFMSDIDVMTDGACVDAKSITGLYTIDLTKDTYVVIDTDNTEEFRNFDVAMEEFI